MSSDRTSPGTMTAAASTGLELDDIQRGVLHQRPSPYVGTYLLLRTVMPAVAANALSLLITAIANTAANRRLTFGIRGRAQATQHQVKGLIAFAISFGLTTGALAGLHAATASPGRGAEVAVLVVANLVATVIRFVLYRSWVFGRRRPSSLSPATNDGSLS